MTTSTLPVATAGATDLTGRSVAVDGRYLARPGMGINRYVTGLVAALVEAGADVTVLTGPAHPVTVEPPVSVAVIGGDTQVLWEQVHLLRHLRRHRYDLYWAPANGGVPLLAPRRQRIVVTEHDLIPILMPSAWFPRNVLWGVAFLVSLLTAMVRADAVVTPSVYSARMVRRVFGRRARVAPPVIRAVTRADVTGDAPLTDPYVLYHGGIGTRKRVDTVIAACALLRDRGLPHRLVLLGRGYEAFDDLCAAHDLDDRVVRPGYVSDQDRDRWVAHAHCVVYPSQMEGFGLPLLEAMNLGVPVVTSRNSSLGEVGGDAALYADPDSPVEVADRIAELDDAERRAAAVEAGRGQCALYRYDATSAATVRSAAAQMDAR